LLRNVLRNTLLILIGIIYVKYTNRLGRGFTPKLAMDFASLMEKQAKPVYENIGIIFPVIASSTVSVIGNNQTASLLDIARALDVPHQLAAQRIKKLLQLDIISTHKDIRDKRKTNYQLTELGKTQNDLLNLYLSKADNVFSELNDELDLDLMALLQQVNESFAGKSLFQRIFSEER